MFIRDHECDGVMTREQSNLKAFGMVFMLVTILISGTVKAPLISCIQIRTNNLQYIFAIYGKHFFLLLLHNTNTKGEREVLLPVCL